MREQVVIRNIILPEDQKLLRSFESDLYFAGLRQKTISSYVRHVQNALEKIGKAAHEIDAGDINDFLLHLYFQEAAGSTIIGYYSALKFFFKRTLGVEWNVGRIPKMGRFERWQPIPLSRDEVRRLITHEEKPYYKLLFILLYSSGMRISEVCGLRLRDVNFKEMLIHVEYGKGGRKRETVLSKRAAELIREHVRRYHVKYWLFPSQKSYLQPGFLFCTPDFEKPIHVRSVQHEFQKVRAAAGVSGYASLHSFRHSFATHAIEDGLSIFAVQKLLGHSKLGTTLKYLRHVQAPQSKFFSPYDNL